MRYIVGGLLAVLLTASYLLFSAKSVEFEIEPPGPDGFSIDGGAAIYQCVGRGRPTVVEEVCVQNVSQCSA